jgi:hypothetical protein
MVTLVLFICCTLTLNTLLASMVVAKLVLARRSALAMGTHMEDPTSQYLTIINTIVESAAMWILPTILYLTGLISCMSAIQSLSVPSDFCALSSSFFSPIFDMASVRQSVVYESTFLTHMICRLSVQLFSYTALRTTCNTRRLRTLERPLDQYNGREVNGCMTRKTNWSGWIMVKVAHWTPIRILLSASCIDARCGM